jgi:hypothetical protein
MRDRVGLDHAGSARRDRRLPSRCRSSCAARVMAWS